ncbi:hypothetical protein LCFBJUUZ_CDS0089 [Staphylococcus phage PG-2021_76]|uniref:Uncharacterized protein n=1 Tax=Mammaliicoccus phage MSShimriz1 TaxID=3230127 RepID=A0AAU8GSE0_9VIRU
MEFKTGDRVRVLRYKGEDVDFYGRIRQISPNYYYLDNCIEGTLKTTIVLLNPNNMFYGSGKRDYYTLVENEKNVNSKSHDSLIEEIERLKEENNTLKNENKALRLQADNYYEMWQDELMNSEYYEDE